MPGGKGWMGFYTYGLRGMRCFASLPQRAVSTQFATARASCCDAIVKMRGQYPETFAGFHGAREPDCTARAFLRAPCGTEAVVPTANINVT